MLRAGAIWFVACTLSAGLIDRVDIVVGSTVITELQLEEEMYVTGFLNDEPLTPSPEERRAAAERLIQQVFIRRDMEVSRYPDVPQDTVDEEFRALRAQYASTSDFQAKLKQYGISEDVLRKHLAVQTRTLRFVGFRFRPEVDISEGELDEYARRQRTNWAAEHPGAPEPERFKNNAALRSALLEDRTDQALNSWIEDTRNQTRISYLDQTLAPVKQ
jgi:hypothetical protein